MRNAESAVRSPWLVAHQTPKDDDVHEEEGEVLERGPVRAKACVLL